MAKGVPGSLCNWEYNVFQTHFEVYIKIFTKIVCLSLFSCSKYSLFEPKLNIREMLWHGLQNCQELQLRALTWTCHPMSDTLLEIAQMYPTNQMVKSWPDLLIPQLFSLNCLYCLCICVCGGVLDTIKERYDGKCFVSKLIAVSRSINLHQ